MISSFFRRLQYWLDRIFGSEVWSVIYPGAQPKPPVFHDYKTARLLAQLCHGAIKYEPLEKEVIDLGSVVEYNRP